MTKICQIIGSSGAGKTTIIKQLLQRSKQIEYLTYRNTTKVYATVMHDLSWAIVGPYKPDKPMGGCDLLHTVQQTKQAVLDLLDDYPNYWIAFEGIIASTIRSTFYDFLLELQRTDGIDPVFIILKADVDTCVEHIKQRGTMKSDLKIDNVAAKCALVLKNAATYDQQYVRYIDVSNTPAENMMDVFLWKIQDNELIDALYDGPYLEPIQLVRTV